MTVKQLREALAAYRPGEVVAVTCEDNGTDAPHLILGVAGIVKVVPGEYKGDGEAPLRRVVCLHQSRNYVSRKYDRKYDD